MDLLFPSGQNFLSKAIENLISSNILLILIIFLVWLVVWLLIREIKTWYWKVNDVVSLLERIEGELYYLATKAGKEDESGATTEGFIAKKINSDEGKINPELNDRK